MSRAEARSATAGDDDPDRKADIDHRPVEPLIGGILHDLGSLIEVASAALDRVGGDPGIGGARTALQRAGTLVRETIMRAERRHGETAPADVGACLTEVATLVRGMAEASIRIELRPEAGLPAANCDRYGLRSAILNLVLNACEAMPDGGLIRISAAAAVRGTAGLLVLRIEDNGIGMTRETARHAFEPFFTTKGKGLGGLGLPMARYFAEQHGGSVDVESTPGSGTTAILRMPAAVPAAPVAMPTARRPSYQRGSCCRGRSCPG